MPVLIIPNVTLCGSLAAHLMVLYLWLKNWLEEQEGQDLVEYALLMGLIAIVCIVAITAGGSAVSTIWSTIASALGSVAT